MRRFGTHRAPGIVPWLSPSCAFVGIIQNDRIALGGSPLTGALVAVMRKAKRGYGNDALGDDTLRVKTSII